MGGPKIDEHVCATAPEWSASSPWRGDGRKCAFPQRNVRRSPLRARPTWHVHCPPPTLERFAPCGVELPSELRHQPLHSVGEILHLRGEERRVRYRWPVTYREKNRKSLGDHLNASLILDADANQIQIPQEHIRRNSCSRFATHASCCRLQCVTPSPQHTCQRTTCTVMVKAVERTAARVGRRAPQKEHTKEVGIEPLRTAVKGSAARGPPWERSNARSSRETRGSNAESKKSCSKNVDASRCQPSLRNGQQPRQTSCQCLGLSCEKSPPPWGTIPMIAEFLATGGCCVVSPTQCPCWMMCDTTLAQGSSVGARHPIHVSCA